MKIPGYLLALAIIFILDGYRDSEFMQDINPMIVGVIFHIIAGYCVTIILLKTSFVSWIKFLMISVTPFMWEIGAYYLLDRGVVVSEWGTHLDTIIDIFSTYSGIIFAILAEKKNAIYGTQTFRTPR